MAVMEQIARTAPAAGASAPARVDAGERAARRTLREQIARLERMVAAASLEAFPRLDPGPPLRAASGPRLLSLGELERVRDELAGRLTGLHDAAAAQGARQAQARELLERMLADPPAHKWLRLANEDLGEPGCRHFHVRPRLGLVGMLMGWWRVKISSGCPLASGP